MMRRRLCLAAFALLLGVAAIVALDRSFPPDLARLAPGTEVTDRAGRLLSALPAPGGTWRFRTAPNELPPDLVALLIGAEDRRFRHHPGVDPLALARAAWQYARSGRIISGGSTLTMQAARLLEPRPRTLRSKLIEIARALQLEARFSKDEILAIWLTLAPQGGNLEGLRAGALAWFGRPPTRLAPAEYALLIALARRPEALRPDRHPQAARAARDALLATRTTATASLTEADRIEARAQPVPNARVALPGLAPHAARGLALRITTPDPASRIATPDPASRIATPDPAPRIATPDPAPRITAPDPASRIAAPDPASRIAPPHPASRIAPPHSAPRIATPHPAPRLAPLHPAPRIATPHPAPRIATTLDLALQRAAEGIAATALQELPPRTALALAILDIETREFRALVGGSFGDETRAGSLDLTRATRSPGSALKPFLYAMAFEAGLARPESVLADLPLRFSTYAPENFDRGFVGQISAADALRQSLNLPAVALLDRLGPLRFATALKAAGAAPRLAPGAMPSLPLALGGAGTTLREMMSLYATLAGGGTYRPPRLTPGPAIAPLAVLSPQASAQVATILTQPFPQGGPAGIAWKTGTSWGGRDAWAFGFDRSHVTGVWIGRPDGTPIPGATGRALALPVLARAVALLPANPLTPARFRPQANDNAPDRLRLLFPPPGAALADTAGPVVLRAMGGQRPLTFLVDGAPLPQEPARREARWTPPGQGFFRITVLDATGQSARAEIRVRAE